jgi:hypothetical protein
MAGSGADSVAARDEGPGAGSPQRAETGPRRPSLPRPWNRNAGNGYRWNQDCEFFPRLEVRPLFSMSGTYGSCATMSRVVTSAVLIHVFPLPSL